MGALCFQSYRGQYNDQKFLYNEKDLRAYQGEYNRNKNNGSSISTIRHNSLLKNSLIAHVTKHLPVPLKESCRKAIRTRRVVVQYGIVHQISPYHKKFTTQVSIILIRYAMINKIHN